MRSQPDVVGQPNSNSASDRALHAVGFCFFAGGLCLTIIIAGGLYLAVTEPAAQGPNPPSIWEAIVFSLISLSALIGGLLLMYQKRLAGLILVAISVLTALFSILSFLLNANFRSP